MYARPGDEIMKVLFYKLGECIRIPVFLWSSGSEHVCSICLPLHEFLTLFFFLTHFSCIVSEGLPWSALFFPCIFPPMLHSQFFICHQCYLILATSNVVKLRA
jgi:hypothetical protein